VIAAFAQALPDVALPHTWEALFGGRTNMAWRGHCKGAPDVVLKLYRGAAQNPLFPNDPGAEAKLLCALQANPIAPRFCGSFDSAAGRCNVYEHLPGRVWRTDTSAVATLMRQLHQITPPTDLRRAPDGSAALLAQIDAILARCQHPDAAVADLPGHTIAPSGAQALLHSDIVPGNLIADENTLHLIDWQCPAMGDPCEDIAIFLSPAMQLLYRGKPLSLAETETFLAAYNAPEITARYRQQAPFYHARMLAYCQWQIENGQPEYRAGLPLERAALQRSFSA
jgi:hypothetical protein